MQLFVQVTQHAKWGPRVTSPYTYSFLSYQTFVQVPLIYSLDSEKISLHCCAQMFIMTNPGKISLTAHAHALNRLHYKLAIVNADKLSYLY